MITTRIRRKEIADKVVGILESHKMGLTSNEIRAALDVPMPRALLHRLQKEGLITQRRGMAADGRIAWLYRAQ